MSYKCYIFVEIIMAMGRIKEFYFNEINHLDEVDDEYLYQQWLDELAWVDEDCIDIGKEITNHE